jgi:hypothetical protein
VKIQGLDLRIFDAEELGDALIDGCWRLRSRFMRLKPSVRELAGARGAASARAVRSG